MTECTWTDRIESAALRESLDADEVAHLPDCAACRSMVESIRLLRAEGRSAERSATGRVPSARALYARAQAHGAARGVREVLRAIVWLERAVATVGVLAFATAAWWLLTRPRGASSVPSIGSVIDPAVAPPSGDPVSIAMTVAVLITLTVAWYGLAGLGGTTRWR